MVIVELKNEEADEEVIGQIQRYLAWAEEEFANTKVRRIIVARAFAKRVVQALRGSKFHIRLVDISSPESSEFETNIEQT